MADVVALKAEIDSDPLSRGYSGMTDEAIADDLNTEYRSRNLSSISGDQCFSATDSSEFAGLGDSKQQLWLAFCGRDSIDPFGGSNVAFVTWIFGSGSDTLTELGALRVESVSRAAELGLGRVRAGTVARAKSL